MSTNTTTLNQSVDSSRSAVNILKCSRRGCTVSNETVYRCPGSKCDKSLHLSCFRTLHGNKEWSQFVKAGIVCTKKCHNAIKSSIGRKPTWSTDGAEGPDDPQSSERLLLDWILTPGNYTNKWRGKDNKGVNKKQVAAMIADLINKAGVVVERDAKQVTNKIQHLERQFRDAYDFCNTETGQGLQANDPEGFDGAVRKICPYYFDLEDIFGDRASTQPKILSTDNLDSSSDNLDSSSESSSGGEDDDSGNDEDNDDENGENDGDIDQQQHVSNNDDGGLMTGTNPMLDGLEMLFSDDEEDGKDGAPVSNTHRNKDAEKQQAMTKDNNSKSKDASGGRKRRSDSNINAVKSSKKPKPVATILDAHTNETLSHLAVTKEKLSRTKEKVAMATLRKLEREEQVDQEKQRIEMNYYKMNRLKEIRAQFPSMEDEEILEVFPEFKHIIKFVPKRNVG